LFHFDLTTADHFPRFALQAFSTSATDARMTGKTGTAYPGYRYTPQWLIECGY
jgi:hypothetical protein